MHGPTQDVAVAAAFLPWAWQPLLAVIIITTAIMFHARTALIVLAFQLFMYFRAKKQVIGQFLVVFASCLAVLWYFITHWHESWLTPNDRIHSWNFYITWWIENCPDLSSGMGLGSFPFYSSVLRPDMPLRWPHSEPILILFESGWIGLMIAMSAYFYTCNHLKNRLPELSVWLSLGIVSLVYNPFRNWPVLILLGVMLWRK